MNMHPYIYELFDNYWLSRNFIILSKCVIICLDKSIQLKIIITDINTKNVVHKLE